MPDGQRTVTALRRDRAVNRGDRKARIIVTLFRATAILSSGNSLKAHTLGAIARGFYRITVDWGFGVELPWFTRVGPGLRIHHGQGIVINGASKIGADVSIHQHVTIGGRRSGEDCPTIGDRVRIGAGAIIMGNVLIGDDAVIGAGAVVLGDVPPGAVAVGNPARVIAAS